jgi:hypothetical protein
MTPKKASAIGVLHCSH